MATVEATIEPTLRPTTPRVVFFGPSFSGKTKLLEAFTAVLTAESKQETVELRPAQDGPSLGRELVPHILSLGDARGQTVILYDCDGQAAGELLSHPDALIRGAARGALAAAVQEADALVLVIDAAASEEVVYQTFQNFGRFLEVLKDRRTFGREVGGLPVIVTLTKCDRLAGPDDMPTQWLDRIRQRQEEIRTQFLDTFGAALASEDELEYLAFGSLTLHQAATSMSLPPGKAYEIHADPSGTFGVQKLVQMVLPAAVGYRSRLLSSRRQLKWILGGAGSLLGTMLFGTMLLLATGSFGLRDPLAQQVEAYRNAEGSAGVRLAEKNRSRRLRDLTTFREAPGFDRLPQPLKDYVDHGLMELSMYGDYVGQFSPPRLGPAEVMTREQLDRLKSDLNGILAPPIPVQAEWADTEAVQLWKKWRADTALFESTETTLNDWFRGMIRRGNALLLTEGPIDAGWRNQVTMLLKEGEHLPFPPDKAIPDSVTVPGVRGGPLTYRSVYEFERVAQDERDWNDTAARLRSLREFTDLLGLTQGPGTLNPILDLPEPSPGAIGSKELATARLAALAAAVPRADDPGTDYPEWNASRFPDPVRKILLVRLGSIYETGLRHVRQLMAQPGGLTPGKATVADWRKVAQGLLREPGLRDWGRLLKMYRSWADPTLGSGDPVQEVIDFVLRDRFDIEIRQVRIAIPDDLLDLRPEPTGPWVLTVTAGEGPPREYRFRREGTPRRDRPYTYYSFIPDGHSGAWTYRPTDVIKATLPIRSGSLEARLVWAEGTEAVYQISRLTRAPRLDKGEPLTLPASGVRLMFLPVLGFPTVPVLLTDQRVDSRGP